ncbi:hypothetical protein M514_03846 [Trichuris suis]|uniref:Uncharacterized protein n=1 Tax=Trichuris suis TaxID=68888 RepID=A0A085N7L1_9BILA|nr:hypothetical protein M513_03846 [Trichuris suis]KFD65457.1 hypothetical protein M514_03846 [Trichuris suis]
MKLLLAFLVLPSVIYEAAVVNKIKEIAGAVTGKTDRETQAALSEYYNKKEEVLRTNNGLYTAFKGLEEQCNEKCIGKGRKLTFPKVKYEQCTADCKLKGAQELGGGSSSTKGQRKPANKKQKESLDNEVTSRS